MPAKLPVTATDISVPLTSVGCSSTRSSQWLVTSIVDSGSRGWSKVMETRSGAWWSCSPSSGLDSVLLGAADAGAKNAPERTTIKAAVSNRAVMTLVRLISFL
jgi:hypothetical protein